MATSRGVRLGDFVSFMILAKAFMMFGDSCSRRIIAASYRLLEETAPLPFSRVEIARSTSGGRISVAYEPVIVMKRIVIRNCFTSFLPCSNLNEFYIDYT